MLIITRLSPAFFFCFFCCFFFASCPLLQPTRVDVLTGNQVSRGAFVRQDIGAPLEADAVLRSIRSTTGTIRGKRNAVRAKLEVLTLHGEAMQDDELSRLYEVGSMGVCALSVCA